MQNNSLHSLDTGGHDKHGKEGGSSSSAVPHSPLQSLVQEKDLHRHSAQRSYQRHRQEGSNRDSRDTLERLIGNSFEKIGDNLLLSSRTRESYEEQYYGQQQHLQNANERPLTSAGKKNRKSSRGNGAIILWCLQPTCFPCSVLFASSCAGLIVCKMCVIITT